MSRFAKSFALFLLFAGLLLGATNASAVACTAIASSAWNVQTTWGAAGTGCAGAPGGIPGAADTVTVPTTLTVTVTAAAAATSLTVNGTGSVVNNSTLTISGVLAGTGGLTNSATGILNIGGNATITTLTATAVGNTVNYTGVAQTAKVTAYSNLTLSGSGVKTFANFTAPNIVSGVLSMEGTATVTVTTGAVTYGAAATLQYNTATARTTTLEEWPATFAATGGVIIKNTGIITLNANKVLSNGVPLAIDPGATLTTANRTLNVGGDLTVNGTLTGTSGAITLSGTAPRTIDGTGSILATTTGTLLITTSRTILNTANLTIARPTTLSAATTVTNNGIINKSTTAALTGAHATTSIWVNAAGSTLNYAGTTAPMATGVLTASAVGNTVNYNGAAQAVEPTTAYHHLSLSGNLAKTMGATTVNGDFTMSGTATTAPTGSLAVGGNFTIGATNTFTAGALAHSVGGNWNNSGTFTAGTSTVMFNGAAAQTIGGMVTTPFNNLTIANTGAGSTTLGINTSVVGNLSVNTGTLDLATFTLNRTAVGGTLTVTNGATLKIGGANGFPANYTTHTLGATSTVEYSGTNQSVGAEIAPGYGNLTISGSGTKTAVGDVTVGGTLTLTAGTFAVGANTLTLNGPTIAGAPDNLSTTAASSLSFGGTASGVNVPGSVLLLNNLTVNNANGITLNSSLTLSGTLALTAGVVTAGSNTLRSSANCTTGVTVGTGYVSGSVELTFPAGNVTCRFPVGSGSVYAPIDLTTPVGSAGGKMTGSTTGNEHPNVASSPVDSSKDVNRFWTLSGDTINASPYVVTFNFVTGDVDIGASPGGFVLGRYAGAWTAPPSPTPFALSITASLTGPIVGITDFVAGEAGFVCSVPAGSPVGTTCVCDNFNRVNLNPSTMFPGANWTVSTNSGTFGLPRIVSNKLRLTDNTGNVATAATAPGTYPAAGNWVSVEFKHYAYNGTGADGIALTLSDSAILAAPGAFGGSLGYAPKTGINGFAGGWVGIAIDEYGNFSSNTEGRTGGPAPGLTIDSVAVRGSGSGQTGYPYLGGTGTLTPPIDAPAPATAGLGHAYRLMVDARGYTYHPIFNPSGVKSALVTVERDTTGTGTSYTPLVSSFDAYVVNASQADVPTDWQLSFTGSTGGSTNIHEIIGLKICAQTIVPPAGYRIQVDNMTPTTCPSDPQPTVTINPLNANGQVITTYTSTVTLAATLASGGGGGASSATWIPYPSNLGTWDGVNKRYTFVAGDNGVAKFYLSDLVQQNVYITVSEYLGTLNSSLAAPVYFSSGAASFVVSTPDTLGDGVVAGRPHLMRVSRNTVGCGGGTDVGFIGAKPLDGWYNPAAEHPTGANAPQICATVSGACLPSYGSCQTLSIAPPVVDSGSNNLNLTFASGVADFCLVTSDVGKYSVGLRDDSVATGTPAVAGTSTTLTARPFAVAVSDVKQGATNNPANGTSGPGIFARAGAAFQTTVAGYLWSSAGDTGSNGLPGAAANWAAITAAGIAPSYADTVTLAAVAPFAPAAGVLSNGGVTVASGSTTATTLSYNEVGSFTLTAIPATSYLNSGVNLGNRVAIFSNPDVGTYRGGLVGRFIPDHFVLAGAIVPADATGGFSYMGEPFAVSFTLTAKNANGGTTANYANDYAKLDPATASWLPAGLGTNSSFGLGAKQGTADLSNRLTVSGTPSGTWTAGLGEATITANLIFSRPASTTPDATWGAYETLDIGVAPQDAEGVKLLASALNLDVNSDSTNERVKMSNTTRLRFGRLRLVPGQGSELNDYFLPVEAQYWNGAAWITNRDDGHTTFTTGNANVSWVGTGSAPTLSSVAAVTGGFGRIRLGTPGGRGTATICLDLGATTGCSATTPGAIEFLGGNWSGGAFTIDPSAVVYFGRPRPDSLAPWGFIYQRENF